MAKDYRRWTELDLHRLRLNYGQASTAALAMKMGRTPGSLYRKADRLGLSAPLGGPRPHAHGGQFGCTHLRGTSGRCWSASQVFAMEVEYGRIPIDSLARRLGRSIYAVRVKAQRLGLAG